MCHALKPHWQYFQVSVQRIIKKLHLLNYSLSIFASVLLEVGCWDIRLLVHADCSIFFLSIEVFLCFVDNGLLILFLGSRSLKIESLSRWGCLRHLSSKISRFLN